MFVALFLFRSLSSTGVGTRYDPPWPRAARRARLTLNNALHVFVTPKCGETRAPGTARGSGSATFGRSATFIRSSSHSIPLHPGGNPARANVPLGAHSLLSAGAPFQVLQIPMVRGYTYRLYHRLTSLLLLLLYLIDTCMISFFCPPPFRFGLFHRNIATQL